MMRSVWREEQREAAIAKQKQARLALELARLVFTDAQAGWINSGSIAAWVALAGQALEAGAEEVQP